MWAKESKKLADFYEVLQQYHMARAAYCMRHRNDVIPEKYRMGTPAPQTIEEAKAEIARLKR